MIRSRIYADHAATTPMREEAIAAMMPFLAEAGFNPSSVHAEGRAARHAVDDARDRVAHAIGARAREIVFVGGGSESITLAIVGAVRAARASGREAAHVVTVATEHAAVLGAVASLEAEGVVITFLPVDDAGRVDPARFAAALRPETVLASVMLANNEIGTIAPIADFARIARERGVLFHTDAVQAPGHLAVDVEKLGVDLLSLSGHKFYGPKGVGMLYVRAGTPVAALVHGGGQEAGLRAGTENVAGVVAFTRALELAVVETASERTRLERVRDAFETSVLATIPGTSIHAAGAERLPHIASLAIADAGAPELLARLDLEGVSASAGSACASGALTPSHVVAALGGERSTGTLRFSFGKLTSEPDVETLVRKLALAVAAVRVVPREMGTGRSDVTSHLSEVRS